MNRRGFIWVTLAALGLRGRWPSPQSARLFAFHPPPPRRTFYVSAERGDDARSVVEAQNPATPWRTIKRWSETRDFGDQAYFAPGTYQ